MATNCLNRLAAEWPAFYFWRSRNGEYWMATRRAAVPASKILTDDGPTMTYAADSAEDLAAQLRRRERS
jgi:hypothetical protein